MYLRGLDSRLICLTIDCIVRLSTRVPSTCGGAIHALLCLVHAKNSDIVTAAVSVGAMTWLSELDLQISLWFRQSQNTQDHLRCFAAFFLHFHRFAGSPTDFRACWRSGTCCSAPTHGHVHRHNTPPSTGTENLRICPFSFVILCVVVLTHVCVGVCPHRVPSFGLLRNLRTWLWTTHPTFCVSAFLAS